MLNETRVEISEVKASRDDFLACAVIKTIADAYQVTGEPPRQIELYGEVDGAGVRTGIVNDFLWGRGLYEDYPYGKGKPIDILAYGFAGGKKLLTIMRKLQDAGFIEERGTRESGTRNSYTPTEAGIAFADALPDNWLEWEF